ncbi:MAG: tetratricopeptide repeat protein [Candidatus Omnitrophota bacterium]
MKRLLGGWLAPIFAGALYLLHPVQCEVAAWVKSRDDLLAGLFFLGAFLLWLRWRPHALRIRQLLILAALYLLACLSKESAIVFPLIILGYEYWAGDIRNSCKGIPPANLWIAASSLFLTGGLYLLWRYLLIGHMAQTAYLAGGFIPTMLTMFKVGVKYLGLLVYPHRLVIDYSWITPLQSFSDWQVWAYGGALGLFAASLFLIRKAWPIGSFGLVWVIICLLPFSNIIQVNAYMAERFLYIPLAGFAILAASAIQYIERRLGQKTALAVIAVILIACGAKSSARANVWKDNVTLFTAAVRDTPPGVINPRVNLIAHLIGEGKYEEALPLARELWEKAKDKSDIPAGDKAEYARNLGLILLQTGNIETARDLELMATKIDPSYIKSYVDLGVMEGMKGNHAGALRWFDTAVRLCPADPDAHYNRAIALASLGRTEESDDALKKAVSCGYKGVVRP